MENTIYKTKYREPNSVGYIYKITRIKTNQFYIGESTNLNDEHIKNYFGSGIIISDLVNAYGKDDFKKDILYWCNDLNDLMKLELELINENYEDDLNLNVSTIIQNIPKHLYCNECENDIYNHKFDCHYHLNGICNECGGQKYCHKEECSLFIVKICDECKMERGRHQMECSKHPLKICKECKQTKENHKENCSHNKSLFCSRCKQSFGNHLSTCKFFDLHVCKECNSINDCHFFNCSKCKISTTNLNYTDLNFKEMNTLNMNQIRNRLNLKIKEFSRILKIAQKKYKSIKFQSFSDLNETKQKYLKNYITSLNEEFFKFQKDTYYKRKLNELYDDYSLRDIFLDLKIDEIYLKGCELNKENELNKLTSQDRDKIINYLIMNLPKIFKDIVKINNAYNKSFGTLTMLRKTKIDDTITDFIDYFSLDDDELMNILDVKENELKDIKKCSIGELNTLQILKIIEFKEEMNIKRIDERIYKQNTIELKFQLQLLKDKFKTKVDEINELSLLKLNQDKLIDDLKYELYYRKLEDDNLKLNKIESFRNTLLNIINKKQKIKVEDDNQLIKIEFDKKKKIKNEFNKKQQSNNIVSKITRPPKYR